MAEPQDRETAGETKFVVPGVDVQIVETGDEDLSVLAPFGKRRADEEDVEWPDEKRENLKKNESAAVTEDVPDAGEILAPPLPLTSLVTAYEESNSLKQNVDAMGTNVDGFGFTFAPTVNFDGVELNDLVRDDMEEGDKQVTEEEVKKKVEELRREAAKEKRRLKQFFSFCADDSFIELRRNSREDLEVLGNFTWEVVRDDEGEIKRFVQIPFYTVRLCKKQDPIQVTVKRKIGPIAYAEFKEQKRFRKFVQSVGNTNVWFKEFGDPRVMSKKTGKYFASQEELDETVELDPKDGPATEVLHYKIHALRGAYGLPRWIGNVLSVRGSRMAEEVNFFYFKNKAIPPMIIFVENGRLQDGAVDRLGDFMRQVKGDTQKFWKVAIIEGESAEDARKRGVAWSGNPRFKIVKLSSEQLKDALFQDYDEKNRDKVGESFRMPRLLRGDVRDFNRATAETAKAFGEEQVFQPERDRFDAWINRVLGPELDMRFWQFKSLSSIVRDPLNLTDMVEKLVKSSVLTPKEGRSIAEDIFNRDLAEIDEDWVKRPLAVTLAMLAKSVGDTNTISELSSIVQKGGDPFADLGDPGNPVDLVKTVKRLLEIRRVLARRSLETDRG